MIRAIVSFCLGHKLLVLVIALAISIAGVVSFKRLPIEAYPDIDDTTVQVITQWEGHAAEEIERQITVPLETALSSVAHHTELRSVSLAGLSVITLVFDEKATPYTARQYVLEQIPQATLPANVQPSLAPMSSAVGQLYWYVLDSPTRSTMELREMEDWEMEKRWKQIPLVADVVSFGGPVKQYHVLLNPLALANYNIPLSTVVQALASNNQNSGGGIITVGSQSMNIRGVGNAQTTEDIGNIIVTQKSGTPVRIKNLGVVEIGEKTRLGKISLAEHRPDGSVSDRDDVVEGFVLSRTGEADEQVLNGIHEKKNEIEENFLPRDVHIKTFLDRSDLIRKTTKTVEENMTKGMVLVLLVLLFFLGDVRSAMIVAMTIPLSLLFASIFLDLEHIPANLLSLGALDFGMLVDGAVIMVENIFRYKQEWQKRHRGTPPDMLALIAAASHDVERPIAYAITTLIIAYLPVFTLQRVEGRLFAPMAWTVAFALMGALICTLTVVPVLCAVFLKGGVREWRNPVMHAIETWYRGALATSLRHRGMVIGVAALSFLLTIFLAFGGPIGSEFLPHLDEGAIWLRGTLPPSTSRETATEIVRKTRKIVMQFPEVPITVCQVGRPDDGTDATGFFNTECFVDLKPKETWRREFHQNKEKLIDAINAGLLKIPGVIWNFSQPISDNVEESLAGVKGALVVKVFGDDLRTLDKLGEDIKGILASVSGIEDLGKFEELGQPNVNIIVDRTKISRYGLNISDVQDVIETAVGGKVASQLVDGEKRFDIVVRYQPQYRDTIEHIKRIMVTTPDGFRIPLQELTETKIEDGASLIYREDNSRYVAVKFSVRGRDLGSTIEDAQKRVKTAITLPPHYHVEWTGEFESQQRAEARLHVVIPLTILAIFFVLYLCFGSLKWASIIMADVATARMGGVLALFLTGTNFSVSSGIGFLAVFGVSVQTGMLLVSYINQQRAHGLSIEEAVKEGAVRCLRPIMMTALVATLGLLPAALSHAIGSDSQRPMAIVIVGGLLFDLVMAFFLMPTLYSLFARKEDKI
jgi:cobalt-zinc-cadmium resistance protein CzcA